MNKIKLTLLTVLLATSVGTFADNNKSQVADSLVTLRHYNFFDNTFIGLYVGDFAPLSENVRPREFFRFDSQHIGGGLTLGKYFSPALGVRIGGYYSGMTGVANKSIVDKNKAMGYDGRGYYNFKHIDAFVDVMPNLTNIFLPYKESRRFNVIGIFGLGYTHRFDMDLSEFNKMKDTEGWEKTIDTKNRNLFAVRAGLGLSYMISKTLDIDLDVMVNATDDKYDGIRYDDKYDGFMSAMLGVKYHFPDHYGDHRFRYRTLTNNLDDLNKQINQARIDLDNARNKRDIIENQQRILEMTVSFPIDKYYISDIQERNVAAVAKYINAHPELNVVICGFADVQTAYPAYNMRLSKRRATSVFRMLVDKYGVDPNRLRIDYKGDTVQPYDRKNEWNRVVVFVLETPSNKR